MMNYSVSKAAKIVGVSRQSIYNKINSQEFTCFTRDENEVVIISDEGLEQLKSIFIDSKIDRQVDSKDIDKLDVDLTKHYDDYISFLKEQIVYLKNQLSIKDEQLNTKDKLIENFQTIIAMQNEQKKLSEGKSLFGWFRKKD